MKTLAEAVVSTLLEGDFDQHIKQWDRLNKWDKAQTTYFDLSKKRQQAELLHRELGQSIAIERALAYAGITRDDVAHYLRGGQIGATDNYKGSVPAKICRNHSCDFSDEGRSYSAIKPRYQSVELEVCPGCQQPLESVEKPISPSDLRGKFSDYILGAELKDGRKVWFDKPIPHKTYAWTS